MAKILIAIITHPITRQLAVHVLHIAGTALVEHLRAHAAKKEPAHA
jgi:hypothetical protein